MKFSKHIISIIFLLLPLQQALSAIFPNQVILNGESFEFALSADFNNDGKDDLAVLNTDTFEVSILLKNASGFDKPIVSLLNSTKPMIAVDFNGDDNLDLIAGNQMILGDGKGGFSEPENFALGAENMIIADFDKNGSLDVVTLTGLGISVNITDASTEIGYAEELLPNSTSIVPKAIVSGDFNGDNNLDIAASTVVLLDETDLTSLTGAINIFYGNGAGGFPQEATIIDGLSLPGSVFSLALFHTISVDLTADGRDDLLTLNVDTGEVAVIIAAANNSFENTLNYAVGATPTSIAMGDYDNDGFLDLAVGHLFSAEIAILSGRANGEFSPVTGYVTGALPNVIAGSDFNDDGVDDLFYIAGERQLSFLFGDADKGLLGGKAYATGVSTTHVNTGDFNGDGFIDLVANNNQINSDENDAISILLGNGAGGFEAATSYAVGAQSSTIISADFNSDGSDDVVTLNANSSDISVLLSDGQGGFLDEARYVERTKIASIAAADMNGDGFQDIVVASSKPRILFGNGEGGFSEIEYESGLFSGELNIQDFNNDGRADIFSGAFLGSSILLNNGLGDFTRVANAISVYPSISSFTSADFDNDGFIDIAFFDLFDVIDERPQLKLYLGDGKGVLADPLAFSSAGLFGATSSVSADFNGDGLLDVVSADLLAGISLSLGTSDGGFENEVVNYSAPATLSIAVADFDNNGSADLAIANNTFFIGSTSSESIGNVAIYLNQVAMPIPKGSIIINSNKAATNDANVNLSLSCSDDVGCVQMQFSNNNIEWSDLQIYASSADWTLATGVDGQRKVYARFIDSNGNISAVVKDIIILDTLAPSAPILTLPVQLTSSSTSQPVIAGTADDGSLITIRNGSTVLGQVIALDGAWRFFERDATLTKGTHSFTATATDEAGNTSLVSSAITYTVTSNGGGSNTGSPAVPRAISGGGGSVNIFSLLVLWTIFLWAVNLKRKNIFLLH